MQSYSKSVKENNEIAEIEIKMKNLTMVDHKKIEAIFENMESLTLPINFYKIYRFSTLYRNSIKRIKKYERDYLDIRFFLFDLTSDVEIEKAIFDQFKDRVNKIKDSVVNSPLKQVNSSIKLNNKIGSILTNINKLEKTAEEQVKHLGEVFVENVKKLDKVIESTLGSVDFMNSYIKHIEKELKLPLAKIVKSYQENENLLISISKDVQSMTSKINALKKLIRMDIIGLKQKATIENSLTLDKLISSLHLLVHANIDFAKFNRKNDHKTLILLKYVRENHGLFISEIKRHKIDNEESRLMMIEAALENFENSINNYERAKMDKIEKYSPQQLSNLFLKVINEYKEYTSIVRDNVYDISKVNSTTNVVNEQIALMNTGLLQIEYNINSLHGTLRDNFNTKKEEIQNKVSAL